MLVPLTVAREEIDAFRIRRAHVVRVPVRDSIGKMAGRQVLANRALPEHDLSAMDGYAIHLGRRSPSGPFPVRRTPIEEHRSDRSVLAVGDATYVMTGAALPRGSNAVVRIESAREHAGLLYLRRPARRGQDILRSGESVGRGDRIVEAGRLIRPVDTGALLALRAQKVPVFALRATILPIGGELVQLLARFRKGTPEYLGPTIEGLLGFCDTELHPPLADDRRQVARELLCSARRSDLVITIGGSSVGAEDVTKRALSDAGGRMLFEGVTTNVLKRGAVGLVEGTPLIVLPGQVVSAVTVFHEHVLHVLSRMVGRELRAFEDARLGEEVSVRHRMDTTYLFRLREGKALPLPWGVARITALLRADAFGTLARGREYHAGDRIRLQRLWQLH